MAENHEQKVNIIIGEALLSLLDNDEDINAETLSAQLSRLTEAETGEARHQSAAAAFMQVVMLSEEAGSERQTNRRPAGVILPWDGTMH
ncbi:hypothetical protein [Pantoea ananatis]|uniref:hypothetical protein n=1 Tax=Pantoea ananas TaxID=553 RepID=UPI001B303027|nr:hypothetical protein [Pantoea ananatis]